MPRLEHELNTQVPAQTNNPHAHRARLEKAPSSTAKPKANAKPKPTPAPAARRTSLNSGTVTSIDASTASDSSSDESADPEDREYKARRPVGGPKKEPAEAPKRTNALALKRVLKKQPTPFVGTDVDAGKLEDLPGTEQPVFLTAYKGAEMVPFRGGDVRRFYLDFGKDEEAEKAEPQTKRKAPFPTRFQSPLIESLIPITAVARSSPLPFHIRLLVSPPGDGKRGDEFAGPGKVARSPMSLFGLDLGSEGGFEGLGKRAREEEGGKPAKRSRSGTTDLA